MKVAVEILILALLLVTEVSGQPQGNEFCTDLQVSVVSGLEPESDTCETPVMKITCPTGKRAKILEAWYGADSECFFAAAETYVQGICDGQVGNCTVKVASPDPFPDPCEDKRKHLSVRWTCCPPEDNQECVKTTRAYNFSHKNCVSKPKFYSSHCAGQCRSFDTVNFFNDKRFSVCVCCQAQYQNVTVKLHCEKPSPELLTDDWKPTIDFHYRDIHRCNCKRCS